MNRGALTLTTYPFDEVRIRCEPCGREGRYRRTRLIERFGGDMSMPEVLGRITADCPRKRSFEPGRSRGHLSGSHSEISGTAMSGVTHRRLPVHRSRGVPFEFI